MGMKINAELPLPADLKAEYPLSEEILEIKKKRDQEIKYFYQEMLEHNSLALVSAHKLSENAKLVSEQRYIWVRLKLLAEHDLNDPRKMEMAAQMLKNLIEVDKMRLSNVSLRNSLDYLALEWK